MKVIIVGGVAGGASCAARLRRLDEKAEIIMVERGPYAHVRWILHTDRGDEIRARWLVIAPGILTIRTRFDEYKPLPPSAASPRIAQRLASLATRSGQ